jgi:hypothetical protein
MRPARPGRPPLIDTSSDDGVTNEAGGIAMTDLSANGTGDDRPEPMDAPLAAAAGMSLFVGLLITVMGLGHLYGVMVTATGKNYGYDFRLAALLVVGMALVFGGALSLSAVRGLVRRQRTAWGRALIGTLLLLLVLVPLGPIQPDMAPGLSVVVAVNLIFLLAGWRGLENIRPSAESRSGASEGPAAARLHCGSCGQVLSPYWRERCGVCKAPFSEFPPVNVAP